MRIKKVMSWMAIVGLVIAVYALKVGFYPRIFDLQWDEEVQLHDGRIIVVHVKHFYERRHMEFGRYTGASARDTELSFDAGGSTGRVTQLFKGHHPLFIGQQEGKWYVVIYGGAYRQSDQIPGQDWGPHMYDCSPAAVLVGTQFKPLPLVDLPAVFEAANLMLLYGDASEHAAFNGRRISLNEKAMWKEKHPPGYGDNSICRPPARASNAVPL